MNSFNKLYNIILESIITEDKAAMIARLKKAGFQNATQLGNQLSRMNNNKLAEFTCSLLCNKQIESISDPRMAKVLKLVQKNNTINLQKYVNNLDSLLQDYNQQYQNIVTKQKMKYNSYLDSIPQFYNKQTYPDGVVIYRVKESVKAMEAVRNVIDVQWGKDANPWCLAARGGQSKSLDCAWSMWKHYNKFPKQIAFQDGKLVAFRASDSKIDYWWDRNDNKSKNLKTLTRKTINIPETEWTEEEINQRKNNFIDELKLNFVYNEKTGRWDTKDKDVHINILNQMLIDGDFPFPFGIIRGNFAVNNCKNLVSCNNGPTKITGNLYYDKSCSQVITNSQMYKNYIKQTPERFVEKFNLKYNQQTKRYDSERNVWVYFEDIKNNQLPVPLGVINGNFSCEECTNLKFTDYLPTKVTGILILCHLGTRARRMIQKSDFYKNYVKQTPQRFIKAYNLVYNEETKMYDFYGDRMDVDGLMLTGWDHIPVKLGVVKGNLYIDRIKELKSLQNCPEEVMGNLTISYNGQLRSLKYFPKHVHGNVQLNDIFVSELDGIQNTIIDGSFDIRGLAYVHSLENFPKLNGTLLITGWQWRDNNIRDYITKHHITCGE